MTLMTYGMEYFMLLTLTILFLFSTTNKLGKKCSCQGKLSLYYGKVHTLVNPSRYVIVVQRTHHLGPWQCNDLFKGKMQGVQKSRGVCKLSILFFTHNLFIMSLSFTVLTKSIFTERISGQIVISFSQNLLVACTLHLNHLFKVIGANKLGLDIFCFHFF